MQPIIKHLFQADTLEDVTRERLEAFVEEYPSFGIGHYLLSRKLRSEDAAATHFTDETRRTNLYFTNPFWLQWLLENGGPGVKRAALTEPAELSSKQITPVPDQKPKEDLQLQEERQPQQEHEPQQEQYEPVSIPVMQLAEHTEPGHTEPLTATPIPGEPIPEEPIRDEEPPFILEETNQELSTQPPMAAADLLLQRLHEAHGLRETLNRINGDFGSATAEPTPAAEPEIADYLTSMPIPGQEEPNPTEEPAQTTESSQTEESGRADDTEELAQTAESSQTGPADETGFRNNTIGASLERAVKEAGLGVEASANKPPDDGQITFEPYHTIDYFASQGIKLSQEVNPGDTLGRQLKSFTDWLKVMRKLPQKEREIVPDIAAERNIQNIAAHSIEGKQVVTETMAEVLALQGMPEKAREVYEKLSLLNPGKRAYFATKIEQLNIH